MQRMSPILPVLFLFSTLAAGAVPAQEPWSTAAATRAKLVAFCQRRAELVVRRSEPMADIHVNGSLMPAVAVMRDCVHLLGNRLLDDFILDRAIAAEVERQEHAGRDPAELAVRMEEVEREVKSLRADFESGNPGIDFWTVVRAQTGLTQAEFLHQRRRALLFDRVFLPGRPSNWPPVTRDALEEFGGKSIQTMLKDIERSFDANSGSGTPVRLPESTLALLRKPVQQGVSRRMDVRFAMDGIPADFVVSVDGHAWRTDEAFAALRGNLTVEDLSRALQEVVVRDAIRQELAARGCLMAGEEFIRRFSDHRQAHEATPFPIEVLATEFKGYPGIEAYRARWLLIQSHADSIVGELDEARLQAHADARAAFFTNGRVGVDLIPFLARDPRTGAWVEDGMSRARERCEAVFAALERKELTFEEAMETRGEHPDRDALRGRLEGCSLNQVRQQLRENEFNQLLLGFSLASHIFFDAMVGTTLGPLPGPEGWYLARVTGRSPTGVNVDLDSGPQREMVREDLVFLRFTAWAGEVIGRAELR